MALTKPSSSLTGYLPQSMILTQRLYPPNITNSVHYSPHNQNPELLLVTVDRIIWGLLDWFLFHVQERHGSFSIEGICKYGFHPSGYMTHWSGCPCEIPCPVVWFGVTFAPLCQVQSRSGTSTAMCKRLLRAQLTWLDQKKKVLQIPSV